MQQNISKTLHYVTERQKMVTQFSQSTMACPHCGDLAPRVKRTLRDRVVSWFIPVKRYRCDYCDWTATSVTSRISGPKAPVAAKPAADTP
jgi:transposase-like protein